jgi:hypothetical protein
MHTYLGALISKSAQLRNHTQTSKWLRGLLGGHAGLMLLAVSVVTFSCLDIAASDCSDYSDIIERVGVVNVPGQPKRVEIAAGYAFIANYNDGLQIVDISIPSSPALVASIDTLAYAEGVDVSGNYLYVAGGVTFYVLDITTPEAPVVVGNTSIPGGTGVEIAGDHAYVSCALAGLQVIDISSPSSPVVIGSVDTPGYAYTVTVQNNYAYVADASRGLQVVDVSTPAAPVIIGTADTPGGAGSVAVSGGYAYIADFEYGLQVVDITLPSAPEIIGAADTPSSAFGVAVAGANAYVADYESGLQVFDITIASDPILIERKATIPVGQTVQAWDVDVSGDFAYITDNSTGLRIVDITYSPVETGDIATPGTCTDIAISGNHAYIADYDGGLQVVDISTRTMPAITGTVDTPGDAVNIVVQGDYAYIVDKAWLQILDVSTPSMPVIVGSVDAPDSYFNALAVSGNYVYITDSSDLSIVDVSSPTAPELVGSVPGVEGDITISGIYAYVSHYSTGLQVLDISSPESPVIVGGLTGVSGPTAISGNFAYVAASNAGLLVLDVSIPTMPVLVGSVDIPGWAVDVAVYGNYAYVIELSANSGIRVIDISTPSAPLDVGGYMASDIGRGVVVEHNGVYGVWSNSLITLPLQCDASLAAIGPPSKTISTITARPNPFNPSTTISFESRTAGDVYLAVNDLSGRRVTTLINSWLSAGPHELQWHGRDASGKAVASGLYMLQLKTNYSSESQKIMLAK